MLVVEGWWTEHVGEDFCKYDCKSWSNTWSLVIYMIYLLNILQAAEYNTQQCLIRRPRKGLYIYVSMYAYIITWDVPLAWLLLCVCFNLFLVTLL